MWAWAFVSVVMARDVVVWELPDYPTWELDCEATLDVAADGAVKVKAISGAFCKKETERLSPALERWRYASADAATVETVKLYHQKNGNERVARQVVPAWGSEADATAGRGCAVHAWIDPAGSLTKAEVPYCPDLVKPAIEAAVSEWTFRPGEATDLWIPVIPLYDRVVKKHSAPSFPKQAVEAKAKCYALLVVDPKGAPTLEGVDGCPEPFAEAVREALPSWRFEKADHTTVRRISVSFQRR